MTLTTHTKYPTFILKSGPHALNRRPSRIREGHFVVQTQQFQHNNRTIPHKLNLITHTTNLTLKSKFGPLALNKRPSRIREGFF